MDSFKEINIFDYILDEEVNYLPVKRNDAILARGMRLLKRSFDKIINTDINIENTLEIFEIYTKVLDLLYKDPIKDNICSYLGTKYDNTVSCKLSNIHPRLDGLMKIFISGTIDLLNIAKKMNFEKEIYNINNIPKFTIFITKLFFFFGLKCLVPPEKYFKKFIADINSIFDKEIIVIKCSEDEYGCGRALQTVSCDMESNSGRVVIYKSDPDNEFINSEGLFKVAMNVQKGCGKKRKTRKIRKARKSKCRKKTYK